MDVSIERVLTFEVTVNSSSSVNYDVVFNHVIYTCTITSTLTLRTPLGRDGVNSMLSIIYFILYTDQRCL
jgi:hypothetical protein